MIIAGDWNAEAGDWSVRQLGAKAKGVLRSAARRVTRWPPEDRQEAAVNTTVPPMEGASDRLGAGMDDAGARAQRHV